MTRSVGTRHELRGDLVSRSPLHIGGWEPSPLADLTVARDGSGRPFIPGTSLAGALRGWLAGQGVDDRLLFGWIKGQDGVASRIRLDDAPLLGDPDRTSVRTGVGIDRHTRSAARGFLYEREVLPAGTRFAFRLVADEPHPADPSSAGSADADAVGAAVEQLTRALRAGHVALGAGRSRGFGEVNLENATLRTTDLSTRPGLIAWLTGTSPWRALTDDPETPHPGRLTVTVDWRPLTPLLVKDASSGARIDMLPLTSADADGTKVRLLLPGSSVKGVLRDHAERIVRTLTRAPAPGHLAETLDQEDLPGVTTLFGRSPRRRPDRAPRTDVSSGWRGALECTDCHSLGHLSAEDWNAVVTARAAPAPARSGSLAAPGRPGAAGRPDRDARRAERQAASAARRNERQATRQYLDSLADQDGGLALHIADHVAVDRWTGGARDQALFSVLEPIGTAWEPLRLHVDCRRASGPAKGADGDSVSLALLLLVLRDLADGWLGFGFGVTRGQGQLTVSQVRFEGTDVPEPWASLVRAGTLDTVLADPPSAVAAALDAWSSHLSDPVLTLTHTAVEEAAR